MSNNQKDNLGDPATPSGSPLQSPEDGRISAAIPVAPAHGTDFVYLTASGNPIYVAIWDGKWWAFYWHADKHWVSRAKLSDEQVERFRPHAMPHEYAMLYHEQNNATGLWKQAPFV